MSYTIEISQLFADQFRILPKDQVLLVQSKIAMLLDDPRPFGKSKTRLVGMSEPPRYRIRAGKYRVIYSFTSDTIWLWNVDKRSDVYVRHIASRYLPVAESVVEHDATIELQDDTALPDTSWAHYRDGLRLWLTHEHSVRRRHHAPERRSRPAHPPEPPLPTPITRELLDRIAIPSRYHGTLIACATGNDLVRAVTEHGLPEDLVDRVVSLVIDPDFDYIRHQPRKQLKQIEDLTRFHDGDLLDFMVALDVEQRQVARSIALRGGPALISGSAGTGKSAVLLDVAMTLAERTPGTRILFTTFTSGLLANLRVLMERIAPHLVDRFDFRTTTQIAGMLLGDASPEERIWPDDQQQRVLREIVRDVVLNWIPARQLASFTPRRIAVTGSQIEAGPLAGMSWTYLLQEIDQVLFGRGIEHELEYLTEPRAGRTVPLSDGQRQIVGEIARRFEEAVRAEGGTTTALLVRDASRAIVMRDRRSPYDAVFVDEAQDLAPTAIRMLVELARDRAGNVRHLYLAADGDQTIYGSSYSWISIHPDLRLQGRSRRLRTNYRSTRQIVEAARSYLQGAELEAERIPIASLHEGPRPIALRVDTDAHEVIAITDFFRDRTIAIGRDVGDCALLVPTNSDGQRLANLLRKAGIEARAMRRTEVDLAFPGVKVMTRQTAKGLEFPIVVVSLRQDRSLTTTDGDERDETRRLYRRLNHMAMTRAMRSLLVTVPLSDTEQTAGMTAPLWSVRDVRDPDALRDEA